MIAAASTQHAAQHHAREEAPHASHAAPLLGGIVALLALHQGLASVQPEPLTGAGRKLFILQILDLDIAAVAAGPGHFAQPVPLLFHLVARRGTVGALGEGIGEGMGLEGSSAHGALGGAELLSFVPAPLHHEVDHHADPDQHQKAADATATTVVSTAKQGGMGVDEQCLHGDLTEQA